MRMKIKGKTIIAMLICIMLLGIGHVSEAKESVNDSQVIYQMGQMEITVSYGIDSFAIQNSYTPVVVKIVNKDKDFKGTATLRYTQESGDVVQLNKEISAQKGETTICEFLPYWETESVSTVITLTDSNGKIVFQKKEKVKSVQKENKVVIGVLSRNIDDFDYLGKNKDYVLKLSKRDINLNEKALSTIDFIVLQDYDIKDLTKEQVETLKKWVRSGKMLVIGSGSKRTETVESVQTFIPDAKVEEFQKIQTNLENDKLQKKNRSVLPIHFENAVSIIKEDDYDLMQSMKLGLGNILVSSVDLIANGEDGKYMLKLLENSMSSQEKLNLYLDKSSELSGQGSHIDRYLKNTDNIGYVNQYLNTSGNSIPKTIVYIPFFVVYILLVGPVLYLILKKKDKREYMWIMVPAISLLFTVLIYIVGYHTRIKTPQLTYVNYMTISGDQSEQNLRFNILTPFNDDYVIPFKDGYNLTKIADLSYYSSAFSMEANAKINMGKNSSMTLSEYPALSSISFQADYQSKLAGELQTEITQRRTQYTGKIQNNLGIDLENCVLILNDQFYQIGTLKNGSELTINKLDSFNYINKANELDGVLKKLCANTSEKKRRVISLLYNECINLYTNLTYGRCYLMGIMKSDNELVKSTGMHADGINLVNIPIEVDVQGGEY
ncbi:hypothetical protein lbkm_2785 [Lachnospiraceae bacterium KM106-2]|nr:hypothetical protein lbkm_2785 [Lachnospiraceae bacterium KM106-2]